jgi:hypothetical protein
LATTTTLVQRLRDGTTVLTRSALLLVLLVFTSAGLFFGFYLQPNSGSATRSNSPPEVTFAADKPDVHVRSVDSETSRDTYYLTGVIAVPGAASAHVELAIYSTSHVTLISPSPHMRVINRSGSDYDIVGTFKHGRSSFSIFLVYDSCYCYFYSPPYLIVNAANVYSVGSGLPNPFPGEPGEYRIPVTLAMKQSEADILLPTTYRPLPADFEVLSSSPTSVETFTNTWVWKGSASGSITAVSLTARDTAGTKLFYAGLLFGLAGAAAIGSVQEIFAMKERSRRRRSESMTASSSTPDTISNSSAQPSGEHNGRGINDYRHFQALRPQIRDRSNKFLLLLFVFLGLGIVRRLYNLLSRRRNQVAR